MRLSRTYAGAIDEVGEFIAGSSRADFLASRLLQRAVAHDIQIVGEAAWRLARDHPTIAAQAPPGLRAAVAMRHRLVHDYARTDQAIVWETATEDLPALRAELAAFLEQLP